MQLSIVIPAYNEEETIAPVVQSVHDFLIQHSLIHEILVVDDASTDKTKERALQTPATVISHKYNKGYGRSLKDGIHAAQYEYVLIMDADGQHTPHDILRLLSYIDEYDMVVGARVSNASDLWRLPGKWFIHQLCNYLVKQDIPDVNSGFRLFKKSVIQQYIHLCSDGFSFTTSSTLAFLADERDVKYIDIEVNKRQQGKSSVSVKTGLRTILLVLQVMMVFHPLRFFLPVNFFIALLAFFYLLYDISHINISDTSVLLIVTTIGIFFFSLLADQLSKLRRDIRSK